MQTLQIFSVYDSKAESFSQPFFCPNAAIAIRSFSEEVSNPQSQLSKYPADFTLFHIGSFNDSTSLLTPLKTPISLGLAIEFLPRTPSPQSQLRLDSDPLSNLG